MGVRYEKALGKSLGPAEALSGVWFEFEDLNGPGYAQVDFLLPNRRLVLEVKLTWVPEARVELASLYIPLVEAAIGPGWGGVVVCKNLVPEAVGVVKHRLDDLAAGDVLHWTGGYGL